jgi:type IV secretory pathway VirB4 component
MLLFVKNFRDKVKESLGPTVKELKNEIVNHVPKTFAEKHLAIASYLGDGVFLKTDNSIGIMFEMEGVYDDPMEEPELVQAFSRYQKFLRYIITGDPTNSSNTTTQVICSTRESRELPSKKRTFANQTTEILKAEEEFIAEQGLLSKKFYIAITVGEKKSMVEKTKLGLHSMVSQEKALNVYINALVERKERLLKWTKRKEREAGIKLKVVDDIEYVSYLNSILNGGKPLEKVTLGADDNAEIIPNIINPKGQGSKLGFDSAKGSIRAFIFGEFPEYFTLGRFKTFLEMMPCNNYECIWTMTDGSTKVDAMFTGRMLWFSRGPSYEKTYNDMVTMKNKLGSLHPKGCLSLRVIAYDVNDDIEAEIVKNATEVLGCPIRAEQDIGMHVLATGLPLNCSRDENAMLGRSRTMRLERALDFLPLYQGPKSNEGYFWWLSRNRSATSFDFFKGDENRITCILGQSGRGKSFINGRLILEFLSRFDDGIIRIVDMKSSYGKIVDLVGGKLIQFTKESLEKSPYSPFAIKNWEEEDIDVVVSFICISILQVNPDAKITGAHTDILEEAIKGCIGKQQRDERYHAETGNPIDPHFHWGNILAELEPALLRKNFDGGDVIEELKRWTLSFGETGQFGFLFSQHEVSDKFATDTKLIVYDLAGISDPRLKMMAAQLIGLKIRRDVSRLALQKPKLCIFEELGVYLAAQGSVALQEQANSFVQEVVKTIRKSNGIPVGISNQSEDFMNTKGGKAFWDQATQRIFLQMTPGMIDTLKNPKVANDNSDQQKGLLSDADYDIIRNLKFEDKAFSDAYVVSTVCDYKGVIRMTPSPNLFALLNTSPSWLGRYEVLKKEKDTVAEALMALGEEVGLSRIKKEEDQK